MKIIDLLTKRAKGEEVPKQFIHRGYRYFIDEETGFYKDGNDHCLFEGLVIDGILNEEIIEEVEDKEYENIEELNLDTDELLKKVVITAQDYVIEDKINALIRNQQKIIEQLKGYEK